MTGIYPSEGVSRAKDQPERSHQHPEAAPKRPLHEGVPGQDVRDHGRGDPVDGPGADLQAAGRHPEEGEPAAARGILMDRPDLTVVVEVSEARPVQGQLQLGD